MLKINRDGIVSDSADVREHPGTGEPMTGIEHPADGTMSPPVSDDDPVPPAPPAAPVVEEKAEAEAAPATPPAAPAPRTPPRRAAPPGGASG